MKFKSGNSNSYPNSYPDSQNSDSDYSKLLERNEDEIAEILKKYIRKKVSKDVYEHILVVTKVATDIAEKIGLENKGRKLVLAGALLHDIGRGVTHGMDHAVEGAKILRRDGFDERILRIVERHIGAGLTAREAKNFGLPEKDYIPETVEEKIVALADNLVSNKRILNKKEYIETVKEKFSHQPEVMERHLRLLKEFEDAID